MSLRPMQILVVVTATFGISKSQECDVPALTALLPQLDAPCQSAVFEIIAGVPLPDDVVCSCLVQLTPPGPDCIVTQLNPMNTVAEMRNGCILSNDSQVPSNSPTAAPTFSTIAPSIVQSDAPSNVPSELPTIVPTREPTTMEPTAEPSIQPTIHPSSSPSSLPTISSMQPSVQPTILPTSLSTTSPTHVPSGLPTSEPSQTPTTGPSNAPTALPSVQPTILPTSLSTTSPTHVPSGLPTSEPSQTPTTGPSSAPTMLPTTAPVTRRSTVVPTTPIQQCEFEFISSIISRQLDEQCRISVSSALILGISNYVDICHCLLHVPDTSAARCIVPQFHNEIPLSEMREECLTLVTLPPLESTASLVSSTISSVTTSTISATVDFDNESGNNEGSGDSGDDESGGDESGDDNSGNVVESTTSATTVQAISGDPDCIIENDVVICDSVYPSAAPTSSPSRFPSFSTPTFSPSSTPSNSPSSNPSSSLPSSFPTHIPTLTPSFRPTVDPTLSPTEHWQHPVAVEYDADFDELFPTGNTSSFDAIVVAVLSSRISGIPLVRTQRGSVLVFITYTEQESMNSVRDVACNSISALNINFNGFNLEASIAPETTCPTNSPTLLPTQNPSVTAPTTSPMSSTPTSSPTLGPTAQPRCHGVLDPSECISFNESTCNSSAALRMICPLLCGTCTSTIAPSTAPSIHPTETMSMFRCGVGYFGRDSLGSLNCVNSDDNRLTDLGAPLDLFDRYSCHYYEGFHYFMSRNCTNDSIEHIGNQPELEPFSCRSIGNGRSWFSSPDCSSLAASLNGDCRTTCTGYENSASICSQFVAYNVSSGYCSPASDAVGPGQTDLVNCQQVSDVTCAPTVSPTVFPTNIPTGEPSSSPSDTSTLAVSTFALSTSSEASTLSNIPSLAPSQSPTNAPNQPVPICHISDLFPLVNQFSTNCQHMFTDILEGSEIPRRDDFCACMLELNEPAPDCAVAELSSVSTLKEIRTECTIPIECDTATLLPLMTQIDAGCQEQVADLLTGSTSLTDDNICNCFSQFDDPAPNCIVSAFDPNVTLESVRAQCVAPPECEATALFPLLGLLDADCQLQVTLMVGGGAIPSQDELCLCFAQLDSAPECAVLDFDPRLTLSEIHAECIATSTLSPNTTGTTVALGEECSTEILTPLLPELDLTCQQSISSILSGGPVPSSTVVCDCLQQLTAPPECIVSAIDPSLTLAQFHLQCENNFVPSPATSLEDCEIAVLIDSGEGLDDDCRVLLVNVLVNDDPVPSVNILCECLLQVEPTPDLYCKIDKFGSNASILTIQRTCSVVSTNDTNSVYAADTTAESADIWGYVASVVLVVIVVVFIIVAYVVVQRLKLVQLPVDISDPEPGVSSEPDEKPTPKRNNFVDPFWDDNGESLRPPDDPDDDAERARHQRMSIVGKPDRAQVKEPTHSDASQRYQVHSNINDWELSGGEIDEAVNAIESSNEYLRIGDIPQIDEDDYMDVHDRTTPIEGQYMNVESLNLDDLQFGAETDDIGFDPSLISLPNSV